MATRAQVEAAVAELDPWAGVIVSDGDGKLLAERPAAEGGGCVLVVLDVEVLGKIEAGRFSARPDAHFTRAEARALRKRACRARERAAARIRKLSAAPDLMAEGTREPLGAIRRPPPAQPGPASRGPPRRSERPPTGSR